MHPKNGLLDTKSDQYMTNVGNLSQFWWNSGYSVFHRKSESKFIRERHLFAKTKPVSSTHVPLLYKEATKMMDDSVQLPCNSCKRLLKCIFLKKKKIKLNCIKFNSESSVYILYLLNPR